MKTNRKLNLKYQTVASLLGLKYPNPTTELIASSPFQLLISTVLAAQCTDKRVNIVTKSWFKKYPDAHAMSVLSIEEIKDFIKSINFFNNKAKHIYGICKILTEKYDGAVPKTLKELISLPGVGRKTAHVIMSVCFGESVMAVDTHVFRVSNRIGLVKANTPLKVEEQLIKYLKPNQVHDFHHYLILHGRYTCKARTPLCTECEISNICDFFRTRKNNKVIKSGS